MPENFTLRIRKEALKFASSHMTVFPDGSKEALHGHQYVPTVSVGLKVDSDLQARFQEMIAFSEVKRAMKTISDQWDEKVLLSTKNPFFKIESQTSETIRFVLCKKQYQLPMDEVELLPIPNVTCEELAKLYSERLQAALNWLKNSEVLFLTVDIEESPGQGASYTWQRI